VQLLDLRPHVLHVPDLPAGTVNGSARDWYYALVREGRLPESASF
jgi:hypothetical protein